MEKVNNKNDEEIKEEKIQIKKNIIIILLVIIILLLLYFILFLNFKRNKYRTGNIDVFEIKCRDNCECENKQASKGIKVNDVNKEWESENKLRIFENPVYSLNEIIAPESTNAYKFVIKNQTQGEVIYNIIFEELNQFNINMKYRLIKDKKYLAGSSNRWVNYDDLNLSDLLLEYDTNDTYYLEWKWFSSPNDNQVGSNKNANYKLKINIKAVELDDEI